jgi:hypothetical protein
MKEKELMKQKAQSRLDEVKADSAMNKAKKSGARADTKLEINHQLRKKNELNEKELYQQKKQAQLDEWKAEIAKLKAKAAGASATTKLEINNQLKALDKQIKESKGKLSELSKTSNDAWESLKDGIESGWDSLKSGVKEAVAKFKE